MMPALAMIGRDVDAELAEHHRSRRPRRDAGDDALEQAAHGLGALHAAGGRAVVGGAGVADRDAAHRHGRSAGRAAPRPRPGAPAGRSAGGSDQRDHQPERRRGRGSPAGCRRSQCGDVVPDLCRRSRRDACMRTSMEPRYSARRDRTPVPAPIAPGSHIRRRDSAVACGRPASPASRWPRRRRWPTCPTAGSDPAGRRHARRAARLRSCRLPLFVIIALLVYLPSLVRGERSRRPAHAPTTSGSAAAAADAASSRPVAERRDAGPVAPVAAGEASAPTQRYEIDQAIRAAEQSSRFEFSVFVGTAEGEPRAYAEPAPRARWSPRRAASWSWSTRRPAPSRWSPAARSGGPSATRGRPGRAADAERLRRRRPGRRPQARDQHAGRARPRPRRPCTRQALADPAVDAGRVAPCAALGLPGVALACAARARATSARPSRT